WRESSSRQQHKGAAGNQPANSTERTADRKQMSECATQAIQDMQVLIVRSCFEGCAGNVGILNPGGGGISRIECGKVPKCNRPKKHDQAADHSAPEGDAHSIARSPCSLCAMNPTSCFDLL